MLCFNFLGFEDLGLYLIERGADIYKQHNKSDASPLEGAVKKKLKRVSPSFILRVELH